MHVDWITAHTHWVRFIGLVFSEFRQHLIVLPIHCGVFDVFTFGTATVRIEIGSAQNAEYPSNLSNFGMIISSKNGHYQQQFSKNTACTPLIESGAILTRPQE